jgi:hypothetical protein
VGKIGDAPGVEPVTDADHELGVALTANKTETALRPMMERPCAIGVLLINGDSPAVKLGAPRRLSKQAPEYREIGLPIAPSGVSNIELDAVVVVHDLPARHSRRDQRFELLVSLRRKGMNVPVVLTARPGHFALRRQPENDAGRGP